MVKPFDPFTSKRLLYRAVEDNTDDEEFIYNIQRDAEAQSGSSFGLLVPESKKSSNKWRESLQERVLMSAIICLPAESPESKPTPIGVVALKAHNKGAEHHRVSYISIDILRPHRGNGYGAEAIEWSLGYGFQMAGLHRIGIETFTFNTGAMRLYSKLGFVLEGRKREEIWFNGEWHDYVTYGVLEGEWRNKMKKEGRNWRE
ncbi:GNAT family acetyltransferase [Truncatella angustata]|uniref:GNAT family acetyltransferase n=1 Tax=Truncatella angustata TaxID=152316 RepID=A0A9P8UU55_9PEZI|nr:GNAT family acetyltransferase [Truncatella angustata]KAH6658254.1 GNAT family acetyltransferase [Truncatella angustata]